MTILYTAEENQFTSIENAPKKDVIYVNITNRCPCACVFCIRNQKDDMLWLEREPTFEEIKQEFEKISIRDCKEIVFCGYGEPLERIEDVVSICKDIKHKNETIKIRINTNGLGNFIHQKDITLMLEGFVDTISISLNASCKEKYLELTNSKFGIDSFDEVLKFTSECKKYIPNVVLTVVDIIGEEEIEKCKELCKKIEVPFRVRAYSK